MKIIKKIILIILIIVFSGGIIYSSYKIINWKQNVDDNKKIKEKSKSKIKVNIKNKEINYDIDFNSLKNENPDTVAYIKVNNTNIDYVVVKGNDNSYYLNHNFNKKYNIAGWIFADYRNKLDETDKNLIIYGHNTKDNSMFGSLTNILKKEWYENKENYKIVLVTENKQYTYEVFSTYSIIPEDYYIKTDFKDIEEYKIFLNEIRNRSIYNYKVNLDEDDKILTLSSCIGDGSKRVVLHSKLVEKE